jgi:hypothetical protein
MDEQKQLDSTYAFLLPTKVVIFVLFPFFTSFEVELARLSIDDLTIE